MTIAISNDDGVGAQGVLSLMKIVQDIPEVCHVFVVAPNKNKSACGHQITLFSPIFVKQIQPNIFNVQGTPADCVKIALSGKLFPQSVDLLVSGINNGPNIGQDIFYSGTVACAREAVLSGIPAIAFSVNSYKKLFDFSQFAKKAGELLDIIIQNLKQKNNALSEPVFLNINMPNIPASKMKGPYITRVGSYRYKNAISKKKSKSNKTYFCFEKNPNNDADTSGSEYSNIENGSSKLKMTDVQALHQNYISVSPISCSLTNFTNIKNIHNLFRK